MRWPWSRGRESEEAPAEAQTSGVAALAQSSARVSPEGWASLPAITSHLAVMPTTIGVGSFGPSLASWESPASMGVLQREISDRPMLSASRGDHGPPGRSEVPSSAMPLLQRVLHRPTETLGSYAAAPTYSLDFTPAEPPSRRFIAVPDPGFPVMLLAPEKPRPRATLGRRVRHRPGSPDGRGRSFRRPRTVIRCAGHTRLVALDGPHLAAGQRRFRAGRIRDRPRRSP